MGAYVVNYLQQQGCPRIFTFGVRDFDLRDPNDIKKLLKREKPDLVIHLAAVVGGIWVNRAYPGTFFYDNLIMGTQLMEQARIFNVKKFVAIGTICAYPKFTKVPFKENDLWNGYPEETNAPYGLAKKMLLVQSQAYRDQYNFNSIYLLPVNLYGPGDNFDLESSHVIPALIRKFVEARDRNIKQVVIWGDGSATREFLYVEDAARAIVLASEKYNKGEPVNIGAGSEISIKELAHLIQDVTQYKGKIIWDRTKPNGQPRRSLDVGRAKREFGFCAEVRLEDGLVRTVEWFEKHCHRMAHRKIGSREIP